MWVSDVASDLTYFGNTPAIPTALFLSATTGSLALEICRASFRAADGLVRGSRGRQEQTGLVSGHLSGCQRASPSSSLRSLDRPTARCDDGADTNHEIAELHGGLGSIGASVGVLAVLLLGNVMEGNDDVKTVSRIFDSSFVETRSGVESRQWNEEKLDARKRKEEAFAAMLRAWGTSRTGSPLRVGRAPDPPTDRPLAFPIQSAGQPVQSSPDCPVLSAVLCCAVLRSASASLSTTPPDFLLLNLHLLLEQQTSLSPVAILHQNHPCACSRARR